MDYFNDDIVARHNDIMTLNGWQVEFFNMMLAMPWLTDAEVEMYHDEKAMYLCYDVWWLTLIRSLVMLWQFLDWSVSSPLASFWCYASLVTLIHLWGNSKNQEISKSEKS